MPNFSQEGLRSKRRNEQGYGSGEYTVPVEHVRQFLQNSRERKPQLTKEEVSNQLRKFEEKLILQLRQLAREATDPQKTEEAKEKMKSVARKLITLRSRKEKLQKLSSIKRNLRTRLIRVAKALEKLSNS